MGDLSSTLGFVCILTGSSLRGIDISLTMNLVLRSTLDHCPARILCDQTGDYGPS